MRAVDTSILARYYLRDDAAQARQAEKVLACLEHLLARPGVTVEDEEQVEAALRLSRQGKDFYEALRHAASAHCREMLTFDDRRFARRAARIGLRPRVTLLSK